MTQAQKLVEGEAAHDGSIDSQLRSIWSEVLNALVVTDADNFVELGGDSIAATICLNRVQAAFSVEVSVTSLLFEDATFASLVEEIRQTMAPGWSGRQ